MIEKLLAHLPTILIVIPILGTLLLYKLIHLFTRSTWKAVHIAVDSSAILYVLAVVTLLQSIIGKSVIGYVIIGLLLTLAIILVIQWRNKTEVILKNGLIFLLRLSFLVFSIGYVSLLIYLLVQKILQIYAG